MITWDDDHYAAWDDHTTAHGHADIATLPARCPNTPDCELSWEPVNAYGLGPNVRERVCLVHDAHPGGGAA